MAWTPGKGDVPHASVALACALVVLGCGPAATQSPGPTPPPSGAETASAREQAARAWQRRDDPASLARALELWSELAADEPELWANVAQAHVFAAQRMLAESQTQAGALERLGDAQHAADRGLAALAGGHSDAPPWWGERLGSLPEGAAPLVYWRAMALWRASRLEGYVARLLRSEEIRAGMQYCLERIPDIDDGGPHRYFGSRFARPDSHLHQDLKRARDHFEAALQTASGSLVTRLRFARDYAVVAQDHDLFETLLKPVLSSDRARSPQDALVRSRILALYKRRAELFE